MPTRGSFLDPIEPTTPTEGFRIENRLEPTGTVWNHLEPSGTGSRSDQVGLLMCLWLHPACCCGTQGFWIRNRLEPDPDPIGSESSWCDQGLIPDPPGTSARTSDPWEAVSNVTNDKYNRDAAEKSWRESLSKKCEIPSSE